MKDETPGRPSPDWSLERITFPSLPAVGPGASWAPTPRRGEPDGVHEIAPPSLELPSFVGDDTPVPGATPGTTAGIQRIWRSFGSDIRERYHPVSKLGEGGMGIVIEAWDSRMNRSVAIKGLREPAKVDPRQRERQAREVRITASLPHPNILPVYDLWEDADGNPWCSMLRVSGKVATLRERLDELKEVRHFETRPVGELIPIFLQVCRAVQYAHDRGILHRDLKPENILLGSTGEALVADWGLAVGLEALAAGEPEVLGTPGYAAPEQLGITLEPTGDGAQDAIGGESGGKGAVDQRADIFSLGMILFEIVAGRRHTDAQTRLAAGDALGKTGPVPNDPKKFMRFFWDPAVYTVQVPRRVPKELAAIIGRATARDPRGRYRDIAGLTFELENYLAGGLVEGVNYTALERVRRTVRHHPVLSATGSVLLLALSAGMLVREQTNRFRAAALREKTAALEQSEKLRTLNLIRLAENEWQNSGSALTDARLEECPERQRSWEWRYLKGLCHRERLIIRGFARYPMSVDLSPSGKTVATSSLDGSVRLFDASTGAVVVALAGHATVAPAIRFSPDGSILASASWDRTVAFWDPRNGQRIRTLTGHQDSVTGLWFDGSGSKLASSGADGTVRVWEVASGKMLQVLTGVGHLTAVAFATAGDRIAAVNQTGRLQIWSLKGGAPVVVNAHPRDVNDVAISADGALVATAGGEDGTVKLWDSNNGALVATIRDDARWVRSVAFHPTQPIVVSCGERLITSWSIHDRTKLGTILGHDSTVFKVRFSKDGNLLASTSMDGTARLWNATSDQAGPVFRAGTQVRALAWSPDGQRLASAGLDPSATIWERASGKPLVRLAPHGSRLYAIDFSPDGTWISTGSDDGTARLWDSHSGRSGRVLTGHTGPVVAVAFAAGGRAIATASEDHTGRLWDVERDAPSLVLSGHTAALTGISWRKDGQRVATSSMDGTVQIWDAWTGRAVRKLAAGRSGVLAVRFTPDGTGVASSGSDGRICLWDAETGRRRWISQRAGSVSRCLTFLPAGGRLASAHDDGRVRIWDPDTGNESLSLPGGPGAVTSALFSADGSRLAACSSTDTDGFIRLWEAP